MLKCSTALAATLLAGTALAAPPPVIVRQLHDDYVVRSDGGYTETRHVERTPTSTGRAERIANYHISFNPSLEQIEIVEAYTEKRDGTRKPVNISAIRAQLAPGVPDVPMFFDIQEKVVVFPDLAPGDTQVIEFRRIVTKPLYPGQFTYFDDMEQDVEWHDTHFSFTAPPGYPLHTDATDVNLKRVEDADGTRITVDYELLNPVANEQYGVAPADRRPRFSVSSFPDYTALAAAYTALNADKARVTPAIKAKADEITAGLTDRHDQAVALYNYVSEHLRYVALYLARGGVEGHPADQILANGYGDCKDHTILLSALLAAKGIDSRTVILSLGNAYVMPAVPTVWSTNHVITYIPEFDAYVDPTMAVATFGTLTMSHFGKTAIMTGGGAETMVTLPLSQPDRDRSLTRTTAELAPDGTIKGVTETRAWGALATSLRFVSHGIQSIGAEKAAQNQLRSLGQTGTGDYALPPIALNDPDYRVTGTFHLEPQPGLLEGDTLVMPLGLELLARPGDYVLGRLSQGSLPDTEPTPCMAATQTEELVLTIPEGHHPEKLPADRTIARDGFTYTSHWSFDGHAITARRELVSRLNTPICNGELRHQVAISMREIRRDHQTTLQLQSD